MSARPQADWREMEPLYRLSPQHDTTRRSTLPEQRERVPPIDAPEMRPAECPLVSVGAEGKAITIGSAYTPPPAPRAAERDAPGRVGDGSDRHRGADRVVHEVAAMSAQITPIGCTGACEAGSRPCTCIPDLDSDLYEPEPPPRDLLHLAHRAIGFGVIALLIISATVWFVYGVPQ